MKMTKHKTGLSIIIFFLVILFSCSQEEKAQQAEKLENSAKTLKRPNILWLVTEDMGHYIPPFGDSTVATPNLSRLASEGVRFTNLFSTSGVCAPSRAAIATGMYPSSIGANHMRTTSYTDVTGLPAYEAVPPSVVKMFSEFLRKEGYYCSNNSKKDYQFKDPVTAWDESSNYAHWRNREEGQPFFSIFNFNVTHESGLFEPYGFRKMEFRHYNAGDTSVQKFNWGDKTGGEETTEYVSKEANFPIPPYLPDNEVVRRDMWKMYNNIAEMDKQLGAILDQLEEDGLLDETIIFFYGDHGGPLPRQKRLIYDSGLKTPLIVRFPDKQNAGSVNDQLVSFVDFAPTVLSLAGQTPPSYLQGQSFIENIESERKYIHAAADRFDGFTDAIRAVRDKRFKYIRNYRPEQGYYLPVTYRERIPTMQELLKLKDAGKLNDIQAQWFRNEKPKEELFDCLNDPHELVNLADDPEHADKLKELSDEMDRWLTDIKDTPNLPEQELVKQLWGGEEQPITAKPEVSMENSVVKITCETDGASIGYRVVKDETTSSKSWQVYSNPFTLSEGEKLEVQAHRIGFKPSKIINLESGVQN